MGISFFTFQQLSYVIDRMNGKAPHYDIVEYMSNHPEARAAIRRIMADPHEYDWKSVRA